jgi:glutathione S-transferase
VSICLVPASHAWRFNVLDDTVAREQIAAASASVTSMTKLRRARSACAIARRVTFPTGFEEQFLDPWGFHLYPCGCSILLSGVLNMMQLYWSPRSRAFTTLWLMEETGQPYERVLIDIRTGAQRKLEYLAINPMGKVPALKDGDATLAEAAAICAYVAERYPEANLAPPVGDPLRAKYLYWLFFAPGCIEPAMVQIATKIEMQSFAAGWGDAQRVYDVLDNALAEGPWILGENFSAADIAIGAALNFSVRQFKMVPSRPSFDAYIDRCITRPAFERAEKIAAG